MKRVTLKKHLNNINNFNANELENKSKKVYREGYFWFPSGRRLQYLVWSERENRCLWVKADSCEVVA